jgi:hypothetical protein
MADDDNFDIDIYGDDTSADYQDSGLQGEVKADHATPMHTDSHLDNLVDVKAEDASHSIKKESTTSGDAHDNAHQENGTQQISSTGGSANDQIQMPKQAPQQQGLKRKQNDVDDRPTDPGATSALMINDLSWWVSEDDIRGWANQSGCEDELMDVTFNEHKVNGKSKGYVSIYLGLQQNVQSNSGTVRFMSISRPPKPPPPSNTN